MAGSMRVFGVNELAMRLPSLLLSTGAVLLTFLIGRVLFNERVALLATGFHAVNGFLVALSAGRRVADHVDTALVFFVALGIWVALKSGGIRGLEISCSPGSPSALPVFRSRRRRC